MKELLKSQNTGLSGVIEVPGDKSISHRSIMFGAIAHGETRIKNFLHADDCLRTLQIFRELGVDIQETADEIIINGYGFENLNIPNHALDVGNSGTTIRLLMGILAGQKNIVTLTGDDSIQNRPMNRVITPLQEMGLILAKENENGLPPITFRGTSQLKPISYKMPVASAQVKSALLFAALQATGTSRIVEKELTRDHTEQMIQQFGGNVIVQGKEITLTGPQKLSGTEIVVPGDISSAAFFIAAALLVPNSKITIKNVGLTNSRTGLIDVVKKMGGKISITDFDPVNQSGNLIVEHSQLKGITIEGEIIPRLIDEIPIIALLATQAQGQTIIRDAEELRVKETDRIEAVNLELTKLGAQITPLVDGLMIEGQTKLNGGIVKSYHDHRMGMMLQIAALLVGKETVNLENPEAISVSYPQFFADLATLLGQNNE
ncbi:3-phosphoshikimate 1-carboxyvinyltransferase [Vagococcus silagei]|uniref:3-phosphoshikimate 1-carboxyvinyltransferase n=1 Tax=Vagococcus silagei TaxID=2508885 RepID=A0A4S3B4R4_9ENTE|nr:3-phosphoshikimate 1-carboxyvinyltransferase [Vagococcus silagei]THB61488.1 3-phosphoshikimate 1-carboxyvinyltransferase [Vagococcus silagei]